MKKPQHVIFRCYGMGFLSNDIAARFPSSKCLGIKVLGDQHLPWDAYLQSSSVEQNDLDESSLTSPLEQNKTFSLDEQRYTTRWEFCLGSMSLWTTDLNSLQCRGAHIVILENDETRRTMHHNVLVDTVHDEIDSRLWRTNLMMASQENPEQNVVSTMNVASSSIQGNFMTFPHLLIDIVKRMRCVARDVAYPLLNNVILKSPNVVWSSGARVYDLQRRALGVTLHVCSFFKNVNEQKSTAE